MRKWSVSVNAPTIQPAPTTAPSKASPASIFVLAPTGVLKLGLKVFRKFSHKLSHQPSFNLFTACFDCPNAFCNCRNYEENFDYINCRNDYELVYKKCMYDCDHNDPVCYATCNREYDQNVENCPCRSNCPNGCPCPDYECSETTPEVSTTSSATSTSTSTTTSTTTVMQSNTTVLVLSSYSGWQPA